MPKTRNPRSPEDETVCRAGKAYGTLFSLWKKFFTILADGPDLVKVTNPNYLSERDRELRNDYQNLLSVDPQLVDILTRKSTDEAARLLSDGREGFRNSEVHAIIKGISSWPTGYDIHPSKSMRGIENDVCGKLLCSPLHDWDDPIIREEIRNFTITLDEDDFPNLLWAGEKADMQDLNRGFLHGEILVRTMMSVLLGPKVAETGEGSGAGGYADRFGMRSVTVPAIAFMAVLARHALTADSKFVWVSDGNRFSYLGFYRRIIKRVSGWPQAEQTQLIAWWNSRVLSRLRDTSRMAPRANDPRPNSIAALMQQQQGSN